MEPPAGLSKQTSSAPAKGPSKSKPEPAVVFITSEASGSKESRQAIRRRAAQHSHRVGRKKPKTKKQKLEEERESAAAAKDASSSRASAKKLVLPLREVDGNASFTDPSSATESSTSITPPSSSPESDELVVLGGDETQVQLHKSHASAMILRHTIMDRDSITTSTYPVPVKPWYPRLLEYMWDWMGKSWQAMDTTAEERAHALSWVQCVTMSEPCYFYMNMLSVADTLQDRNLIEPRKALWLTNQVVRSINSALNDPARMQSPGVILAVGRIALEEIVTGNRDVGERYHRPAQARLIAMAGGLDALGLPSLVLKHVCWADRVLTRITDVSMVELNSDVGVETRTPVRDAFGPQPVDRDLQLLNNYRPQRRRRHGEI